MTRARLAWLLSTGALETHFQPVVDLKTGMVVAAEALARLADPSTGQLRTPGAFLPVAETSGLVCRLDELVMDQAMAAAARWRLLWPTRALQVGVNLSVLDLDDQSLPQRMIALARQHDLALEAVMVEVTESLPSLPGRGHARVLEQLADLGCTISLDDFGVGSSALTYLARFPIQVLKLDRSFIAHLGTGSRGDALTRSLVRFGHDLGLQVIAEGIESHAQLRILTELDCQLGQGFLFSEPLPPTPFEATLGRPLPQRAHPSGVSSSPVSWSPPHAIAYRAGTKVPAPRRTMP